MCRFNEALGVNGVPKQAKAVKDKLEKVEMILLEKKASGDWSSKSPTFRFARVASFDVLTSPLLAKNGNVEYWKKHWHAVHLNDMAAKFNGLKVRRCFLPPKQTVRN